MNRKDRIEAGTYRVLNKHNGKMYNGSSIDVEDRLIGHKRNLTREKGQLLLQRAWNKYGSSAFVFELTKEVAILFGPLTKEDKIYLKEFLLPNLLYWEQVRLDEDESYKPEKGYNISPTAGSCLGYRFTEKQRQHLRDALKGENNPMYHHVYSEETLEKMSRNHADVSGENNPMYGENIKDHMTSEAYELWRKHLSESSKIAQNKPERRKQISEQWKGKPKSNEWKEKAKIAQRKRRQREREARQKNNVNI